MAGENENVMKMAEILAKRTLPFLGWKRADGPRNNNWECQIPTHDAQTGTHPCDDVYWYDDPYSDERVYLLLDLKSYGKTSITKTSIAKAVRKLIASTACANISEQFRNRYANDAFNHRVVGLLFVYNHDAEYGEEFRELMGQIDEKNLVTPPGVRTLIWGPKDVLLVQTLVQDIINLHAAGEIPGPDHRSFFYPALITRRPRGFSQCAATIEMLTSPWQIMDFRYVEANEPRQGYVIWYRGDGSDPDQFVYLFDMIFRYQLLHHSDKILLRLPNAHPEAISNFAYARRRYALHFHSLPEFEERLNRVKPEPVPIAFPVFNSIAIGMRED